MKLKDQILATLALPEAALPNGISVADIAAKLGVKKQNVHVWFSTTGKKTPGVHKVGEHRYALTISAAPVGAPQGKSEQIVVATGKSKAKTIDLVLVDESLDHDTPKLIVGKRAGEIAKTFTAAQLEAAIVQALATTEQLRKGSAVWDIRTGVLFHIFQQALQVKGRKYTGFWQMAEDKFGVSRATVSKKMRLVKIWADETGADADMLQQLASASDLNPDSPAVRLALDWIGDHTTSDLYRIHKLTNVGPQGGYRDTKADGTPRDKKRTKAQILRDEFEAAAPVLMQGLRKSLDSALGLHGPEDARAWDLLSDEQLAELKLGINDLRDGLAATQKRRAVAAKKGPQI